MRSFPPLLSSPMDAFIRTLRVIKWCWVLHQANELVGLGGGHVLPPRLPCCLLIGNFIKRPHTTTFAFDLHDGCCPNKQVSRAGVRGAGRMWAACFLLSQSLMLPYFSTLWQPGEEHTMPVAAAGRDRQHTFLQTSGTYSHT